MCERCPPDLLTRIWNFTRAQARHARDGFRIVTQEEQAARLETCRACPLLVADVCTHEKCGCGVSGDRSRFWSKLAWASEECPLGKWV
jgi:hypothetical protein